MNDDFSHDPLDSDSPLPDHLPDGAHLLSSAAPLDTLPSEGDISAALHSAAPSLFDHGPDLGAEHAQSLGSHVIGEPDSGGVWHQQQTRFTCAVVAQEMILREYGVDVNEAQLMGDAMEHGWLSSGGLHFKTSESF